MVFKVGDRVKPKPGNETFSAGEVARINSLGLDCRTFMHVHPDVPPPIQYTTTGNPTLVMTEWFELEGK